MKIGIDYGSKLAGTTVIAYREEGKIHLVKSVKNKDADLMILEFVKENNVSVVGIDAPLSLPGVYSQLIGYNDYHYRACDKALKAMSPMFLGGLTARAMKLRSALVANDIEVFETYPVKAGNSLFTEDEGYRSKTPDYESMLDTLSKMGITLAKDSKLESGHDLDAILALDIVDRINKGDASVAGDSKEGVIYY
ncbi:hypothetical protein BFP97_09875 [Roseivirga sp. 4D4]|uniref:DUF429 domain-containing protein n=1 Tax=Roseivirga sp. 4D4 TaxID=1889784 RepID=UPI0008530A69|nr:DUF429 domain-containing protein [Roseivirga sp. 4D4]OEK01805.1 hypothetical protein BFP97_09875 [Roseivirga sp. 4D4]